jgi:uncharacterized protein YraI
MRILRVVCLLAVALSAFLSTTTHAQSAKAGATLRAEPTAGGKVVKVLSEAAPVNVIGRKGFWINVKVVDSEGWLSIKELSASKSGSRTSINTGRQTKGNIVVTSAARGLTSEDLTSAKPDFDAFGQLTMLGVTAGDAAQFAKEGQLASRELAMLSGPTGSKSGVADTKGASGKKKRVTKAQSAGDDDEDDDEDEDEEGGED